MICTGRPHPFGRLTCRLLLMAFFAFVTFSAVSSEPAQAHAALIDSFPRAEAIVGEAPENIMLFFDQPVRLVSARMLAAKGEAVSVSTNSEQSVTAIRIALDEVLTPGVYIFAFRGVSSDGHPVQGTLRFALGTAQTLATAPMPIETSDGWLAAAIAMRFANTMLLAIVAGGLVYRVFVAQIPTPTCTFFAGLACVGAAASIFDVVVRAGFSLDAPSAALFDPVLWRAGFEQTSGRVRLVAALGFLLLAFAWRKDARAAGVLGLVLVGAGIVGSSHAAAPEPRWFGVVAIAVHVAAALYWVGAFAPLLGALARRPDSARGEIDRFARHAPAAIATLVLSGAALLAIQSAGTVPPLTGIYILAAALKLSLVLAMLAAAADNRWQASPMWAREPAAAAWRFARNLRFESAMALGVIGLATVLAFSPPPRTISDHAHANHSTLESADVEAATVVVAGTSAAAVVTVAPGRAGSNSFEVSLADADDLPLAASGATLTLARRGDATGQRHELRRTGPGAFRLAHIELSAPGLWRFNIRAETASDSIELETEVTIK